jgi:hypothetical protein
VSGHKWPVTNAHGAKPAGENLAIDPVAIAPITPASGVRPPVRASLLLGPAGLGKG